MGSAGRPRIELTDEQINLIEKLAGFGLTQAQIADCLPMSERTLRNRLNNGEDPEIAAAYRRGRARDLEAMSERHRDIAMGNVKGARAADQRKALEWRMERQHGWAQQQQVEHSGPGGAPIEVNDGLSDDQRAARIAAILDRGRARRAGSSDRGEPDDVS